MGILKLGFSKKIKGVFQSEISECGLACIAMIADYHGFSISMTELRKTHNTSMKGVPLKQIIANAANVGLAGRALKLEIGELRNIKLPCILHWNMNHYVVLEKIYAKGVLIHDPAIGARKIYFSELSESFTGIALELWPNNQFTKRPPAPQLRLFSLIGRVTGIHKALTQIILFSIALEVFSIASPFFIQWTIDEVIVSSDTELLSTLAIGFLLILIVQQATTFFRSISTLYMGASFSSQWRANITSHLFQLPIAFFEKRSLGDITARLGSAENIQQATTNGLVTTLIDGLVVIVTLSIMFLYSAKLAAISMTILTSYLLLRYFFHYRLMVISEELQLHTSKQQSHLLESIRGMRAIKLYQKEVDRRASWVNLLIRQINSTASIQKSQALYKIGNGLLLGVENIAILWLGSKMVMAGEFTVGALMAFNSFRLQLDSRTTSTVDKLFELIMLRVHVDRLSEVLTSDPEPKTPIIEPNEELDIKLFNVSVKYSQVETQALSNISLEIKQGESIALVGPSGCGKSTFIKALLGIVPITEGRLFLGRQELKNPNSLRSICSAVMQDDVLFAGTIQDNISFFSEKVDEQLVRQCASIAQIHSEILQMPMGYNSLIGDMGSALSGGQKQRILLARAIYKRPQILILDEATSHLDVDTERKVSNALKDLRITKIMIAHRPEAIASADRVIMIYNGKVSFDTATESLIESGMLTRPMQI